MKKSLYAILVMLLSFVGANAWASKIDLNVEKVNKTSDFTASQNGNNDTGGRNLVTMEK